MAVFALGRLQAAGDVVRDWRGSRQLPLYVAGLVGGAGLVIGIQTVIEPAFSGQTIRPAEVQAPFVGPAAGAPSTDVAQPGAPSRDSSLLAAEVLAGDEGAPAVLLVKAAPETAPQVAPVIAPAAAPSASAPLSAPPIVVPEQPEAPPAASVPVAEPVAPTVPEKPNFYVPAASTGPMTDLERRLFEGLNVERAAAGLPPYAYDAGLSTIARTRSQQMIDQGYFAHRDPYGYSMYVELLAYFGYRSYAWAGENLALNNYADFESPERAITALMNSATHRSNILQTLFTRVGIGEVTHADGRKFYTMIFLG